jgi:hypothetical protein
MEAEILRCAHDNTLLPEEQALEAMSDVGDGSRLCLGGR